MRTVTWLFPLCTVTLVLLLVFAGNPSPGRAPAGSSYQTERSGSLRQGLKPSFSVVQQGTAIVFSHLGDGPFENRFLQTTLLLANNTPHSTSGTIEFFSDAGTPLEMTIAGTTNSTFSFQIPSGGMKRFVTSGTGALKVGWAHVHSQQPITGMASFGVRDARGTIYSDVGPDRPGRRQPHCGKHCIAVDAPESQRNGGRLPVDQPLAVGTRRLLPGRTVPRRCRNR